MAISDYLRGLRARIGHELLLVPSVAVMVRDDDGRLLLVRDRSSGIWQTVGGAMDPQEHPADAAVREAWEETGLHVELTRIIGVYGGPAFCLTYPNGDVVSYVGIAFAARAIGDGERPDHEEVDRLGWYARDAALTLPMAPHTRLLIADAFRDADATLFQPAIWQPPAE